MKILFATPHPPSRIRVRSLGLVSCLARQHEVTVLTLCTGEQELADVLALQRSGIAIDMVVEKSHKQWLRSLQALVTPLPLQVAFGSSPAMRTAIATELRTGKFDLLHVEHLRTLGILPKALPIPTVWDAVDCVSRLYELGARAGATPLIKFIGSTEARRTQNYEREQLPRFRHVLVTSANERQALFNLVGGKIDSKIETEITVLPNGVDQEYFRPHTGTREPKTIIFSGKMSFHANVAGIQLLVEHIMPYIWAQEPEVRLIIAGSNPPTKVQQLASNPRIEITGYVPDLRPYLAKAHVAVCPLPYAVGIQNKVLEAMAMGTPVVASSSAVAGLQASASNALLIADEPKRFAEAVLHLLADQVLWQQLVTNALAYIAINHNWANIVCQLKEIYADALDSASISTVF